MDEWYSTEGSPSPLGVTWIEKEEAFNFALYSKYATDVTLLLYSSNECFQPLHEHRSGQPVPPFLEACSGVRAVLATRSIPQGSASTRARKNS